jgi:hypothetical protein
VSGVGGWAARAVQNACIADGSLASNFNDVDRFVAHGVGKSVCLLGYRFEGAEIKMEGGL